MTVFIASMAFTVGSLFAFVGPRHCGMGMHNGCDQRERTAWNHHGCGAEQPDGESVQH